MTNALFRLPHKNHNMLILGVSITLNHRKVNINNVNRYLFYLKYKLK